MALTSSRFVVLAMLALMAPLLAGCIGGDGSSDDDSLAPDSAPEELPVKQPNPKQGNDPELRSGSLFVEDEWGFVRSDFVPPAEPLAIVFSMDGYEGASAPYPTHYLRARDGVYLAVNVQTGSDYWGEGYATAYASIRGTGCSGGTFDLFDRTHALDGYELVEWLAAQPWSTGKVGIIGFSYPGITAFFVAATDPPHLAAAAPNMLIADVYRDILYPGGILNDVFPVVWALGYRPLSDVTGTNEGLQAADEICAQNVAGRGTLLPTDNLVLLATRPEDNAEVQRLSLLTYASQIKVPTSIGHAWQDEQTGPRGGPELFNAIHPDPVLVEGHWVEPKRLITTNGVHGSAAFAALQEDKRWFDHWLRGIDTGLLLEPPVKLYFGAESDFGSSPIGGFTAAGTLDLEAFPSASTMWTRFFLREGGALSHEAPAAGEGPDAYVTGTPRQGWVFSEPGYAQTTPADVDGRSTAGADVLTYRTEPVDAAMVVAGPITATLHVASSTPDMDLFVSIADVAPDGALTHLQRGMLRASHRALDLDRTLYNAAGEIARPYHPHTHPTHVAPGEVVQYELEVFPLAHIFFPGHQLQVQVLTPPLVDGIWGYSPVRLAGVNQLYHDADHASSVLFPVVAWPGELPPEPDCGAPDGYRCLSPPSAVEDLQRHGHVVQHVLREHHG